MDNKKLAEMLFPDNKLTVAEIEKKYPKRKLENGTEVTRFAPSPTGYMHLGGFFQALINFNIAKRSGGVFYLRIEDTDQKREIAGASEIILDVLGKYGLLPDEYELKGGVTVGEYGPYFQTERKEIYKAYAKKLVAEGKAFPCFCRKTEGLSDVQEAREKKFLNGSVEEKDPCRNLTIEQIEENLKAGKKFAIRLKSAGTGAGKIEFSDLSKGKMQMQENAKDAILLKNDLMPTYHFAHAIDDTLMGTTTVVRGEEWLPSYPLHKEIFDALSFKQPKYMHTPLIYKFNEQGNRIKISKRKHPEANMQFFEREGYEKQALVEYLLNLINSNFEAWRKQNPTAPVEEFPFSTKITAVNPIFDLVKLNDVSKEMISHFSAQRCYESLLLWAREFSPENAQFLTREKEYVLKVLNIDREKPKPRKDIYKWSMFFEMFDYMFGAPKSFELDENERKKFEKVAKTYPKFLNLSSKDVWFEKIKEMAVELGYATNNAEFKQNPEKFEGNTAKVCEFLRLAITGRRESPDLFEIMSLLGENEVKKRLANAL